MRRGPRKPIFALKALGSIDLFVREVIPVVRQSLS